MRLLQVIPIVDAMRMIRWLFCFSLTLGLVLSAGCGREPRRMDAKAPPAPAGRDEQQTQSALPSSAQPFDRDREIELALSLLRRGDPEQARAALQRVLLADPEDVETLFRLARLHAEAGEFEQAVALLESIPQDHPEAGLPAIGQAADWCLELERYDDAEQRYRQVLAKAPDLAFAHRQLAFLYNRQGRRHEAADHIRTLCRLGDVQQDELHALMIVSHAIFDDPNEPASGGRRYLPIGPAATARMLYTASRHSDAVAALEPAVAAGDVVPAVMAFYGLLAIEAQDTERFQWWLSRADERVREFAEYWAAIGAYLVSQQRFDEAVRALGEALDRDPTDIASMRRINQALTALGRLDEAERWIDRYVTQREATLASNAVGQSQSPRADSFATIADGLEKLQRPLEAITWRLFEAFYRKASPEEIEKLNSQRSALLRSEQAFPNQDQRLCGLELSRFPLPELAIADPIADLPALRGEPQIASFEPPRFENVAAAVGLDHTYHVASQPQPFRFALYQSLGGGVAVLDYNLDGLADLYLAQGGSDPPEMVGEMSNLFYQNVGGRLLEVTGATATGDHRYSVGATAGDWNQDGFGDLVIANIGNKVLLINNGDGTFRRHEFDLDADHQVLTSSVAMADLTGDAIPEIVALHYVEDKTMLDRPGFDSNGNILTVSPASFEPGTDRIAVNDGRGGLRSEKISQSRGAKSTGLGVVVADWDGTPGNEIFVGNDVRPNHLWVRSPSSDQPWVDVAALRGCAYGYGGVATASMGIAVGDFDGSGTLDIHITNFYLEPVSLFLNRGGTFEDRCIQFKLDRDSSTVLGFGCQAIDYNLDGRPDLAVTNGNIEKAPGEPLQQPPQFFVNLGTEFRLAAVDDPSGYWQGAYLGRGMARLDFNRDGKADLLITHIGSPTALLLNRTETGNHWLAVQLVGTESERDAIGARVAVHAGEQVWNHWIVAGDGYLCRNEAVVTFGLGSTSSIDKLVVTWPSGKEQSFSQVAVNQHVLLIENNAEVFVLGGLSAPDR